jgi:hypothetical protein
MRLLAPACLSLALAAAAPAIAADKYEMADLQALEKQEGWEELAAHLEDIVPSKRDAAWLGLAERACGQVLASAKVDPQHAEEVFATSEGFLKRFPQLKLSKAFMAKRAEAGLNSFAYTYSNYRHTAGEDPWLDKMKEFVKADSQTADLPQRAARTIQSRLVADSAWPFWKMAIDKGSVVCKDADFQKSILAAFESGVWKEEIRAVAQGKCWAALKAPLIAGLAKTKEDEFAEAVCPVFKAKGVKAEGCKR